MGPQTSEPGTMNLQRVGQRARFQCMDNGHHNVLQGPSLPEKIDPRHNPMSFFQCLWCVGGSQPRPFCLSLLLFYSSFLPPEWGPWGRCLSYQLFPPVVGSGCKDREVWSCQAQGTKCNNDSLSLRHFHFFRCPFLLQCFSCSVERYEVSLPVAGCLSRPRLYPCRGGFSPWPRRGSSFL